MVVFGLDCCDVCFGEPTQYSPMFVIEIELGDGPEPATNFAAFATSFFVEQELIGESLEHSTLWNLLENASRPKGIEKLLSDGDRFDSVRCSGGFDDPSLLGRNPDTNAIIGTRFDPIDCEPAPQIDDFTLKDVSALHSEATWVQNY